MPQNPNVEFGSVDDKVEKLLFAVTDHVEDLEQMVDVFFRFLAKSTDFMERDDAINVVVDKYYTWHIWANS